MKTLLIQQGSGAECRAMLLTTATHHRAYATRHDMDLWTITGPIQTERNPFWDKTAIMQRALASDQYGLVIWLDADTLIANSSCDLRDAAKEFETIGMTRHQAGWGTWQHLGWHFNAGVIFVRPSDLARQAFQQIWDGGSHADDDQQSILDVWSSHPYLFQTLSERWNSFAVNPCKGAVVKAWHGYGPGRAARMAQELWTIQTQITVSD